MRDSQFMSKTKQIIRYITDADRKEHDAYIAEMEACIAGGAQWIAEHQRRSTDARPATGYCPACKTFFNCSHK